MGNRRSGGVLESRCWAQQMHILKYDLSYNMMLDEHMDDENIKSDIKKKQTCHIEEK
jgi:hypothetical protein